MENQPSEFLTTLLQRTSEGILLVDLNGTIAAASDALWKILNIPQAPRRLSRFWAIFSDDHFGFSMREALQYGLSHPPVYKAPLEISTFFLHEECRLIVTVREIAERQKIQQPVSHADPMIVQSPAMKTVALDLEKIAKSQASVFITGESGTGKEVVAAAIHRLSSRASQPFIKVNCAAIPETLIESEFFGHERGAFTGALVRKTGRFELADKGTLLLDEVTEISLPLQAKLLRAIQEMEFERVGGTRSVKVNVRLLASSNRCMSEAIESKTFREDLYYRLNVIPIHLPPLRQRTEDIIPLTEHFLRKFCENNQKPNKSLTSKATQKLLAYHWPGNVRELANVIERTVVLDFHQTIDAEHLYLDTAAKPGLVSCGTTLHAMEKRLILETLEAQGASRTKTAATLGISVRTLRNKLHEYGEMCGEEA